MADNFIPWAEGEAQRAARIAAERWSPEKYPVFRTCRICNAPNRYDFDVRLLTGTKLIRIGRELGANYPTRQVKKHRDKHLSTVLIDLMPEIRGRQVNDILMAPFPKESGRSQLEWCLMQALALREKQRTGENVKPQIEMLKHIRETVLMVERAPHPVKELPAPTRRATDNGIAEFPEHNENLDNAFALSRVRNREEEEAVDVTESRT